MSFQRYLFLFIGIQPEQAVKFINLASRIVLVVCSLLLSIFGILGNLLAIKILRRKLLRENALSIYLVWLAAMNICCLLVEMSRFFLMGIIDFNYREISYEFCVIHRWTTVTVITVCNWFVVAITLGRWLLLRYPNRTATLLKQTKVYVLILLVIFSIGLIKGSGLMLWFDFDVTGSREARHYFSTTLCRLHAASLASIVIRVFVGVVPLVVLVFFSFLIFYQVKVGFRHASLHLSVASMNRKAVRESKLAMLLLISNAQFMVTNLPLAIYYLTSHKFFDDSSKLDTALSEFTGNVALMSLYGGYATNCLIYCFFGSRFRSELIKFLYENGICHKYLRRGTTDHLYGQTLTRTAFTSGVDTSQKRLTLETVVSRPTEPEPGEADYRTDCIQTSSVDKAGTWAPRSTSVDHVQYESRHGIR